MIHEITTAIDDESRASMPLGAGRMHKIIKFATEEQADAYWKSTSFARIENEREKLVKKIIASKAFYDQYKHFVSISVEGAQESNACHFPHVVAKHNQIREETLDNDDVSFWLNNPQHIIKDLGQLPDFEAMRSAHWGEGPFSQYGRAILNMPFQGGICDVMVDNELLHPIVMKRGGPRFKVVVTRNAGTSLFVHLTGWISPDSILDSAEVNFKNRVALLEHMEDHVSRLGPGSESRIASTGPMINASVNFSDPGIGAKAAQDFEEGKRIKFASNNRAILTNFSMANIDGEPALATVLVAIRFRDASQ